MGEACPALVRRKPSIPLSAVNFLASTEPSDALSSAATRVRKAMPESFGAATGARSYDLVMLPKIARSVAEGSALAHAEI
jgi:hypothetical protein